MTPFECPHCQCDLRGFVVCRNCGRSCCEEEIKLVNDRKDELLELYRIAYEVLKARVMTPPDNSHQQTACDILDVLPEPSKVAPIDVVCLGDSIRNGLLECFYMEPTPLGIPLGRLAADRICDGIVHQQIRDLSHLRPLLLGNHDIELAQRKSAMRTWFS